MNWSVNKGNVIDVIYRRIIIKLRYSTGASTSWEHLVGDLWMRMASKSAEKLIRRNLKFLRGDNVSVTAIIFATESLSLILWLVLCWLCYIHWGFKFQATFLEAKSVRISISYIIIIYINSIIILIYNYG